MENSCYADVRVVERSAGLILDSASTENTKIYLINEGYVKVHTRESSRPPGGLCLVVDEVFMGISVAEGSHEISG